MTQVYFTPNSARLFKKIHDSKVKAKVKNGLVKLGQDPYLGKKLKGKLERQHSLKIWPYRIIYCLTRKTDIVILDIGHRKDIYR